MLAAGTAGVILYKYIQLCFSGNQPRGNHLILKTKVTLDPYPQELSMKKVLEHLIEPFLLCIFFQDLFQKDAYVIDLSVCWQKVDSLGTGTEMRKG
jgi:hypothetical protein